MNLFKSKKSSEPTGPQFEVLYDPFAGSRGKLNTYLEEQIGKPGPKYEGERVAPITDLEQKTIEKASSIADRPEKGQSLLLAEDEIKKTLSGEYDPSTSPFYQAVKAESERNFEQTKERIGDAAAGGRRYFSGARLKATADAATDSQIALDKMLGSLAENERQNRLNVIPQALSAESQAQNQPLKQALALQEIGALPRELQQAVLDAMYEEFILSEYEYPLNIAQLASGPAQQEPIFVQQGYGQTQPSIASRIVSFL